MGAPGSLKAAIELAQQASDEQLVSAEVSRVAVSAPLSRVGLVDDAIASIAAGSAPSVRSGVVDVLAEWLLHAVLINDLDAVEEAQAQLVRLAAAAARRQTGGGSEDQSQALAELHGATSALVWVGRLAAEALVGPALVRSDTYAGRMLALIESTPGISNKDLARHLKTDKTQVSRTGRKLLDGGLAAVSRVGAANYWRATAKGVATLARGAESPQRVVTSERSPRDRVTITPRSARGRHKAATQAAPARPRSEVDVLSHRQTWTATGAVAKRSSPAKAAPTKKAASTAKASGGKSAATKSTEGKSAAARSTGRKSAATESSGGKSAAAKFTGGRPAAAEPSGKSGAAKSSGRRALPAARAKKAAKHTVR